MDSAFNCSQRLIKHFGNFLSGNAFIETFNPPLPFKIKFVDGVFYQVLEDPLFCNIFWLKYYRTIFAPKFERQQMITSCNTIEMTMPVWIKNNQLEQLPSFTKSVLYFDDVLTSPPSVSLVNLSGFTLAGIGCLFILLICILTFIFKLPVWF